MYVCTYVLVCPCVIINGPLTRVDHLPVTHVIPHVQAASSNLRWHQFTRYHQRWLADHVQTEEEEFCGQWLLHQSPEVRDVREPQEYRPGRGQNHEIFFYKIFSLYDMPPNHCVAMIEISSSRE